MESIIENIDALFFAVWKMCIQILQSSSSFRVRFGALTRFESKIFPRRKSRRVGSKPGRTHGHRLPGLMVTVTNGKFFVFLRFTCILHHSNRARCGSFGRRWGRPSQRRTGLRWSRFGKHGKDGSLILDDPWNESKICQAKHVMKSSVFVCLFNDSKSSSVLLLLKDSSMLLQKWHQNPDSSQMFLKDAFFFQDECLGSIAA